MDLNLNKQNELELWKKYKTGDKAVTKDLLRSVNPLLQKQISKYQNTRVPRLAIETKARELAVGAFNTYDPSKAQLNTHLVNNLKHLQRFTLEYQNVAKIPENRGIAINKFKNIQANLNDKLGREPTVPELADELDWDEAEVERMILELRKDLTMNTGEDLLYDSAFEGINPTLDAIWFVYEESDNEDKKILEMLFGLRGMPKSQNNLEAATRLNRTESYVKKRSKELASKIIEARKLL
jgi:DNA-directed RNA polymerase specialized sigma subunit